MIPEDQELERVIALKRMPLFRYLPLDMVAQVARSGQPRVFMAGEEVIAAGALRQDLLILEKGVLAIEHPADATRLAAPACFGEAALVGDVLPWPRIAAVEDCRVWFLHAPLFQELCREHPQMALELCRLLARRVREAGVKPHESPALPEQQSDPPTAHQLGSDPDKTA